MINDYFSTDKFNNPKILCGFFTRKNGFSKNNFASLNCNYDSGDDNDIVYKNIEQAQKKINLNKKKLKVTSQIHSNKVVIIDRKNINNKFEADGIITQDQNINIAVLTADCCPIFLFDDDTSFISCLHAGWKGCYLNIIKNALIKIKKIQPVKKKINAIIGPCLNKENFEVKSDLIEQFLKLDLKYEKFFITKQDNNKSLFKFNMRGLIEFQLLKEEIYNIENIDIDTYCNKDLFYSHRRSTHENRLPTGRMINIIGFNS